MIMGYINLTLNSHALFLYWKSRKTVNVQADYYQIKSRFIYVALFICQLSLPQLLIAINDKTWIILYGKTRRTKDTVAASHGDVCHTQHPPRSVRGHKGKKKERFISKTIRRTLKLILRDIWELIQFC